MITLATTIHDPHKGLEWLSTLYTTELTNLFDAIILVSSPFTPNDYLEGFKQNGWTVIKRKDNKIGKTYFEAVKQSLKTNPDYILYCDFDRILHWVHHFPGELKSVVKMLEQESVKKKKIDYIICERRPEDYKAHQESLYYTEQLPNKIISTAMGEKTPHDFLSGCFIYSKKATEAVIAYGGSTGYQFWGNWPVYLKKKKFNIIYKRFKGLSWETPNQNQEAVQKAGGVEKWRELLSSPSEWKKRTSMAGEFVQELIK